MVKPVRRGGLPVWVTDKYLILQENGTLVVAHVPRMFGGSDIARILGVNARIFIDLSGTNRVVQAFVPVIQEPPRVEARTAVWDTSIADWVAVPHAPRDANDAHALLGRLPPFGGLGGACPPC